MATITVDEGRIVALDSLVSNELSAHCNIGLFTAPAVPVGTNVLADVVAATFPGYAAQALAGFAGASLDPNSNAAAPAAPNTFTETAPAAPETVLGWYVWDVTAGRLLQIKLFDSGPQVFSNIGDSAVVTYTAYLGALAPPF